MMKDKIISQFHENARTKRKMQGRHIPQLTILYLDRFDQKQKIGTTMHFPEGMKDSPFNQLPAAKIGFKKRIPINVRDFLFRQGFSLRYLCTLFHFFHRSPQTGSHWDPEYGALQHTQGLTRVAWHLRGMKIDFFCCCLITGSI